MHRATHAPRRLAGALALVLSAASIAGIRSAGASGFWHAHLLRSAPAKDDTLAAAPKAIRLWYSEKVEVSLASVKLVDAKGASVAVGAPAYETMGDSVPLTIAVKAPVAAGKYTVNWSVAAADGHPSKGSFDFTVRGSR